MIDVQLTYHLVHKWTIHKDVSILGKLIYNNEILNASACADYFADVVTEQDFVQKVKKAEGHFSILVETGEHFFIAVDNIRTFPLFIYQTDKAISICDHIHPEKASWNYKAMHQFQKVYCTLENTTLLNEYRQLQAGEYAVIEKKDQKATIKSYFKHTDAKSTLSIEEAEHILINNTLNYANNRTILIPLSGGYDSRYLLALLLDKGYTNIQCFTYGKKDSYEVLLAKNVCEKLKVKWQFIEYTNELLQHFFSEEWEHYSCLNHQFSSLPHEQDFFALHYLKENNLLPHDAVVMNGYCQDILAGSFIEPVKQFDLKNFINYKHDLKTEPASCENSWTGYQEWLVKNRLSKFIVNSVRVYAYFGLDFYLPFWNSTWCQFWYSLPLEKRKNQTFYTNHLFKGLFRNYAIDFKKPDTTASERFYTIKKIGKSVLPKSLSRLWQFQKNKNPSKDYNNTLYLYEELYNRLSEKPAEKDFRINNIHALYFLQNLKDKYPL